MGALIETQELKGVEERFIEKAQRLLVKSEVEQEIKTDLPFPIMAQSGRKSEISKRSAVTNFNNSRSRIVSKKGDISEILDEDSNEVHYEVANITVLKNSARFLWHAVTQNHFPELDIQILDKIRSSLENAVKTYYKANEISGCLNKGAINYKSQANKEDGSCILMDTASIFGGIHRTCSFNARDSSNKNFLTKLSNMVSSSDLDKESEMRCARMSIQNQLTNKLFCPIGFSSNLVHRQRVTLYTNGGAVDFTLDTFSCSRPLASGYIGNQSVLFGGSFELAVDDVDYEEMQTLVQAVNGCPSLFQPIHFVGKFFICLAQNVPELRPSAVSFGGFISCQMSSQQACPLGYTPRLITDWQSCPVSHCIRERDVNPTGRPIFKLPPFMNYPSTDPSDQPPTRSKRSIFSSFRPKHRMNYDRSIGKGRLSFQSFSLKNNNRWNPSFRSSSNSFSSNQRINGMSRPSYSNGWGRSQSHSFSSNSNFNPLRRRFYSNRFRRPQTSSSNSNPNLLRSNQSMIGMNRQSAPHQTYSIHNPSSKNSDRFGGVGRQNKLSDLFQSRTPSRMPDSSKNKNSALSFLFKSAKSATPLIKHLGKRLYKKLKNRKMDKMEHIENEMEDNQQQIYDNNDYEYLQDERNNYLHDILTEQPEAHCLNYTISHDDLEDIHPTEEKNVEIVI
ncbi:hypothetical protein WR25_14431 [Diploscapter pachys]|uniref:Uncharacterized protein n=1 Tax=Diploscapter pachys TaxID=2018661 RepID=A0A2A2JG14_9BILA|nr:hypothetical protein WR25_14431 [Diploscapter pachys]